MNMDTVLSPAFLRPPSLRLGPLLWQRNHRHLVPHLSRCIQEEHADFGINDSTAHDSNPTNSTGSTSGSGNNYGRHVEHPRHPELQNNNEQDAATDPSRNNSNCDSAVNTLLHTLAGQCWGKSPRARKLECRRKKGEKENEEEGLARARFNHIDINTFVSKDHHSLSWNIGDPSSRSYRLMLRMDTAPGRPEDIFGPVDGLSRSIRSDGPLRSRNPSLTVNTDHAQHVEPADNDIFRRSIRIWAESGASVEPRPSCRPAPPSGVRIAEVSSLAASEQAVCKGQRSVQPPFRIHFHKKKNQRTLFQDTLHNVPSSRTFQLLSMQKKFPSNSVRSDRFLKRGSPQRRSSSEHERVDYHGTVHDGAAATARAHRGHYNEVLAIFPALPQVRRREIDSTDDASSPDVDTAEHTVQDSNEQHFRRRRYDLYNNSCGINKYTLLQREHELVRVQAVERNEEQCERNENESGRK